MKKIISVDIETVCDEPSCSFRGTYENCEHALDFKRNAITAIGSYHEENGEEIYKQFTNGTSFHNYLFAEFSDFHLVGHNFKFDLKTLNEKGANISLDKWGHDTLCMAVALPDKVSESFLERYEKLRGEVNKSLKLAPHSHKKDVHRKAGGYSLKTLAPHFLGVEPFWEVAEKSDEEYVYLDCKYTYKLYEYFQTHLKKQDVWDFYQNKLMPWNKMLYKAEVRGVRLDVEGLRKLKKELSCKIIPLKERLDENWQEGYKHYHNTQVLETESRYRGLLEKALEKSKTPDKTIARYDKLKSNALEKIPPKLNLDSPTQLLWLLRNYLKYNVRDNYGKEGTGKEVLKRLVSEGKEDIETFLEYRGIHKILNDFIPQYESMLVGDTLHCSFNIAGTRTGRLSSSKPNLQQVPPILRPLFIPRDGYSMATYDMSAIEPNIIAFYSEDEALCKILLNGDDFHGDATKQLVEYVTCSSNEVKGKFKKERDLAKVCDLSLFYGTSAGGLQRSARTKGFNWTSSECKQKLNRFKNRFSGVFHFKSEVVDKILESESLTNILGRKFKLPNKDDIYMKGLNRHIQSSASDLVVDSGRKIMEEASLRGMDVHLLMLVHDELIVEYPTHLKNEVEELIERKMTEVSLPTKWGEIKLKVEGGSASCWEK